MEKSALLEKLVFEEYEGGINLLDFKPEFKNEIEELIIPDEWNVVAIKKKGFYGEAPFEGCQKLKKVTLPSTLKELEEAFCSCESLEEVIFPENLEMLGNWNFRDCKSFSSVTLPQSLKRVGFGNFADSPVYLSEYTDEDNGCIYLGKNLLKCVINDFDTLEIKDGTVLIADCACSDKRFSKVIFPNTLRYIGSQAFYCCNNLEKPDLPESILSIGEKAFYTENGDLIKSIHVTDGYFDKDGKLVLNKELGFISEAQLEKAKKQFDGYLLKIYCDSESSYDNSDDERVEDSHSSYSSIYYRELDLLNNTKALLRIDGEIKGVVFRAYRTPRSEPDVYPFIFDDTSRSMTLGYSASHSSNYITVNKISLAKKGVDEAPDQGGYINFEPSTISTSI